MIYLLPRRPSLIYRGCIESLLHSTSKNDVLILSTRRLFPDGSQGSESERSDKPAAPVHPFHPNITIRRGVLASECADIMQQFFQLRRKRKEKRQSTPPAPPSTHAVSHHPRKILTKLHDIFHIMFCL